MKDKKKIGKIIFGVICILIVLVCGIIQIVLKNKDKELNEESKKYDTLITETKSGTKVETEYIHVDNEKFYIKVPKDFKQLDSETINIKYSGDVPNIVFSNDETTINVLISLTDNNMTDKQINNYIKSMENLLKDNSEILETKYYKVDNHSVGKIKLMSNASDTKIYNNMIAFSYNGKLVIVSFNCTEEEMDEWTNVGDFIIDSLFFKE